MQIYITKNGKQFGPYTRTQLYSYVQSGTFVATDPAWWQGSVNWKTIDDVGLTDADATSPTNRIDAPTPVDSVENPFPVPEFKDSKIRKVQIVKPGQMKDSSQLPISVKIERFFDRHNHKMEFLRTLFGLTTIALQLVILAKLFGLM